MKREKRLTKRERKALDPTHRAGPHAKTQHIHCVACGRHLDPSEFDATPATATTITCEHGSRFAENNVVRGPAATRVVVVHTGQVVVNKRIGMNELNPAGKAESAFG
jgi:hypothetical protein